MIDKKKLIEAIVARLEQELGSLLEAAQAAREAATHEESKAEDQYDTRGLEASYLAGAQAERALQIQRMIATYKFLPLREAKPADPIAAGDCVEVESAGRRTLYFLVPQGGGISIQLEGRAVQVITPQAPLGEALLGRKSGETIEVEIGEDVREYRVLRVH